MARSAVGARDVALRALGRRELSAAELTAKLLRAGVGEDEARETVASLQDAGLQSDARAASERARVLAERGLGDSAIVADLAGRGIELELIEAAVGGVPTELERAERLAARSAGGAGLAQALARKGFSRETAESVLASVVANES